MTAPLPAQDWELVASPGHVIGRRAAVGVRRLFLPACAALIVGVLAGYQVVTQPAPALPQWLQQDIPGFDPATVVKLPGGGVAAWELTYLAGLTPEAGLGRRDFKALVDATGADTSQFGDATSRWQAVANLDKQPLVTRPQKVFGANAGRLGRGLVVLPEGYQPGGSMWVVAWVEGRLTWIELSAPGCLLLLGSREAGEAAGCDPAPPDMLLAKVYGTERFALFRPASTGPVR